MHTVDGSERNPVNSPVEVGSVSHLFLQLSGGNSNMFYVHPDPWGNDPI